jgi:hypothetical protein
MTFSLRAERKDRTITDTTACVLPSSVVVLVVLSFWFTQMLVDGILTVQSSAFACLHL